MKNITVSLAPQWHFDLDLPEVSQYTWNLKDPAPAEHLDIVVSHILARPSDLEVAASVGASLLQLGSIGYETVQGHPVPAGLAVANGKGVYEDITAELTVANLLYAMRELKRVAASQADGKWDYFRVKGLTDARVGLVGVGGVGREITKRLLPFQVDLLRFATRARTDDFGEVHELADLEKYLPSLDALIVVVPLTDSTRGLLGEKILAGLPDGATVLNMARGEVADTEALLRHASRLKIVADVTDPEPLPEGHPLFAAAELITAHIGGASEGRQPRMKALLTRQIEALRAGKPFENLVTW